MEMKVMREMLGGWGNSRYIIFKDDFILNSELPESW
jgi:hypothetical protein